jgi:uncharacterized protein YbcC (UPF0753/DUF2309 family)
MKANIAKKLHNFQEVEMNIQEIINKAANILTPVWPIKKFIACNPLHGFEDLKFDEALEQSEEYYQNNREAKALNLVNCHMIKWCQAFLDEGQASLSMPNRELGFYQAWKSLAQFDSLLHENKPDRIKALLALEDNPKKVIEQCLRVLKVPELEWEEFLRKVFAQLSGWAGYIKNLETIDLCDRPSKPITLMDYMAVRLVMMTFLWPSAYLDITQNNFKKNNPVSNHINKIKKHEKSYDHDLYLKLPCMIDNIEKDINTNEKKVQMIFCIDVRSEPFRSRLEKRGAYETFGFAGFFGLPIKIINPNLGGHRDSCPAILKPKYSVDEIETKKKSYLFSLCKKVYKGLKYNFSTPFVLADMLGLWFGFKMLTKTYYPKLWEKKNYQSYKKYDLNMSLSEKIACAESALRGIGLTKNFSPIVIFCGHASQTDNNPYASALDCGACGGNSGAGNAKILADILNTHEVREGLINKNIYIPQETIFMGAEHNTTTDQVEIFKSNVDLEKEKLMIIRELEKALLEVKNQNSDKINAEDNAINWANVRPEWGLARNAAFIVAPRMLTKNIDLDGRCFLHSYEPNDDISGEILESIFVGPLIVAQWINHQYLFSTLDNLVFGSGTKITHNVVGKIGVMQGNASDLMHGLPLQSVYMTDTKAYHEPIRLRVIVYAPKNRVIDIIQKHAKLQNLFSGDWLKLIVLDPIDKQFYELGNDLCFK